MILPRVRWQLPCCLGLAVALGSPVATARDAAVLSVHVAAPAQEGRAVIERVLRARGQLDVLTDEEVTARITTAAPAIPVVPETAAIALAHDSLELLRGVAFGEDGATIERGRAVLARERARAAALDRSDGSAIDLSDVCFFVVRALLHRGDSDAGRDQARECLRLVPDAAPGEERHPPSVRTLLSSIHSEPKGRIAVSAVAPGREPCTLRVQGRPFGHPPAVVELVPGTYSVELDCGSGIGRLHQVAVTAAQMTTLRIAPNLDMALRVQGSQLVLDPAASRLSDAEIGLLRGLLLTDELWLFDGSRRTARLTRIWTDHGQTRTRASEVPIAGSPERIEALVADLACDGESCRQSELRARTALSPLGLGIGVTGIAAIAASWVLYTQYARSDSEMRPLEQGTPAFNAALQRRDAFATAAWVTSAIGSASLAGAAPMLLPRAKGMPWWALATGAAGATLASVGTVVWLRNGTLEWSTCPGIGACLLEVSTVPLGPMLVFNGASLLSVPATYLVRSLFDDAAPSMDVSATHGGVLFRITRLMPL
jgi:hypothetical protein